MSPLGERARRWGFRVGVGVLGAGAAYYLLLGGEYGVPDVRQMQEEAVRTAARVDSLNALADSLERRAESLRTDPLAIERAAREEQGLVRDGERVYRFVAPAPPKGVGEP